MSQQTVIPGMQSHRTVRPTPLIKVKEKPMKSLSLGLLLAGALSPALLQAQIATSVRLTDVIKSNGTGNINVLKDISASQLEALRFDNDGVVVLGVDVNEAASGTEKASTQAVTVKSVRMTVIYPDRTTVYDEASGWLTETQALVAEKPSTARLRHYTLLGEAGSSRITSGNAFQDDFDSTLKINVADDVSTATSITIAIELLETNESLGDPEAFYDYSNGFEDLAVLNSIDAAFIDGYGAGISEAPTVILTNPPPEPDPEPESSESVSSWNYFPSSSSYYIVGYEDLYPQLGDYDFNDLTVAYQVRFGLNSSNELVSIRGTAYLLTRGAGFDHDWRLRLSLPSQARGSVSCTTATSPSRPLAGFPRNCNGEAQGQSYNGGTADLLLFSSTKTVFPPPAGSDFTNTESGQALVIGPKSTFEVILSTPLPISSVPVSAPFDPYLRIRNGSQGTADVQLLQVNPSFKDDNGFPFGMLLPSVWLPPQEFFSIRDIYPLFNDFVASEGTRSLDWPNTFLPDYVVNLPDSTVWAW